MSNPTRRTKIGEISVESGTVTIGDPCYLSHPPDKFLYDWQGVDEKTFQLIPSLLMLNHFAADPPNCVTVLPGWGDGEYDVIGTFITIPPSLPGDVAYERLAKVEIVFIEAEEEPQEIEKPDENPSVDVKTLDWRYDPDR